MRNRAGSWLRVFTSLVKTLDQLSSRQSSPLMEALAFLIERNLHQIEREHLGGDPGDGPAGIVQPLADPDVDVPSWGDRFRGLRATIQGSGEESFAADELDVLLILAEAWLEDGDDGRFVDPALARARLAEEFRSLRVAPDEPGRLELLPAPLAQRWVKLFVRASTIEHPLRRLSYEMALMRVIRCLYAIAIGERSGSLPDDLPPRRMLLALTLGDHFLGGAGMRAYTLDS
jgi:hypothetical protein